MILALIRSSTELLNRPDVLRSTYRFLDPGSLSLIIMTLTYPNSRSAFVMQSISAVRKTYDRHRSRAKYLGIYSRLALSRILRPRP